MTILSSPAAASVRPSGEQATAPSDSGRAPCRTTRRARAAGFAPEDDAPVVECGGDSGPAAVQGGAEGDRAGVRADRLEQPRSGPRAEPPYDDAVARRGCEPAAVGAEGDGPRGPRPRRERAQALECRRPATAVAANAVQGDGAVRARGRQPGAARAERDAAHVDRFRRVRDSRAAPVEQHDLVTGRDRDRTAARGDRRPPDRRLEVDQASQARCLLNHVDERVLGSGRGGRVVVRLQGARNSGAEAPVAEGVPRLRRERLRAAHAPRMLGARLLEERVREDRAGGDEEGERAPRRRRGTSAPAAARPAPAAPPPASPARAARARRPLAVRARAVPAPACSVSASRPPRRRGRRGRSRTA